MCDPIQKLRHYLLKGKEIVEHGDHIILGRASWPKGAKTNFVIHGTGRNGKPKDYYTLHCVLYFLKNMEVAHATYVRRADALNIPVVDHQDRVELVKFFASEDATSSSIDKNHRPSAVLPFKRGGECGEHEPAKKLRVEGRNHSTVSTVALRSQLSPQTCPSTHLFADGMTADLKTERLAKMEAMKMSPSEPCGASASTFHSGHYRNVEGAGQVLARERQGRDQVYDRYRQEQFKVPGAPTSFKINTMATFVGTVPSGTGAVGNVVQATVKGKEGEAKTTRSAETRKWGTPQEKPMPFFSALGIGAHRRTPKKRPIIVVPSMEKSLITMYNAREFLEECKYVSSDEKKASGWKKAKEILIRRTKPDGTSTFYRVVDDVKGFTEEDWNLVVLVFVEGPAWQFKGWPWGGKPEAIFRHVFPIHVKFAEMDTRENVVSWGVDLVELSRIQRHLDYLKITDFWALFERRAPRAGIVLDD